MRNETRYMSDDNVIYIHKDFQVGEYIITDEVIEYHGKRCPVKILWDTGAQNFHISSKIVNKLNMIPIGSSDNMTVGGIVSNRVYDFTYIFHEEIPFPSYATETFAFDNEDFDMIIGINFISLGCFQLNREHDIIHFTFSLDLKQFIE